MAVRGPLAARVWAVPEEHGERSRSQSPGVHGSGGRRWVLEERGHLCGSEDGKIPGRVWRLSTLVGRGDGASDPGEGKGRRSRAWGACLPVESELLVGVVLGGVVCHQTNLLGSCTFLPQGSFLFSGGPPARLFCAGPSRVVLRLAGSEQDVSLQPPKQGVRLLSLFFGLHSVSVFFLV